jgi:hypothetical protein
LQIKHRVRRTSLREESLARFVPDNASPVAVRSEKILSIEGRLIHRKFSLESGLTAFTEPLATGNTAGARTQRAYSSARLTSVALLTPIN